MTPTISDFRTRIEPHIERVTESGCWIWMKSGVSGYGRIRFNGHPMLTHRLSYEAYRGQIPDGLCIDHLCRVRACCNPDHLEAVHPRTNVLRGVGPTAENARKDKCEKGHYFNEENTYFSEQSGRSCRACDRERYRSNKEVVLKRRADYYARNAETIKERARQYRAHSKQRQLSS